ncbi:MAG: hypothetical protein ACRC14_18660 [Paracoccaceae bacterium]
MRRLTLALCLFALPATAQETAMTAAEFEAYATGKTLTYARDGEVWGVEQYLPGRRVIWAFTDDECKDGTWYEDHEAICFLYQDEPFPQCWTFYMTATGLSARYLGDTENTPLSEVAQSTGPMPCMGPGVGV